MLQYSQEMINILWTLAKTCYLDWVLY